MLILVMLCSFAAVSKRSGSCVACQASNISYPNERQHIPVRQPLLQLAVVICTMQWVFISMRACCRWLMWSGIRHSSSPGLSNGAHCPVACNSPAMCCLVTDEVLHCMCSTRCSKVPAPLPADNVHILVLITTTLSLEYQ